MANCFYSGIQHLSIGETGPPVLNFVDSYVADDIGTIHGVFIE